MPLLLETNVIKLSIRALILEETLLKKGFFQAIFPKLLKVFGNGDPLWRGFKGKTLFQKGFPLNLMTLLLETRGGGDKRTGECLPFFPALHLPVSSYPLLPSIHRISPQ
jgi:hypothetical protein